MKRSLKTSFWGVLILHLLGLLLYFVVIIFVPKEHQILDFDLRIYNVVVCSSIFIAFYWQYSRVYRFLRLTNNALPIHYLNMFLVITSTLTFTIISILELFSSQPHVGFIAFEPSENWSYILFSITLFQGIVTYLLNIKLVASKIKRVRDRGTRKLFYRIYQNPMVNTVIGICVFLMGCGIYDYLQRSILQLF